MSEQAASALDKDTRIAELEAALAVRDTLIETLRFQLAQLRRMTFASRRRGCRARSSSSNWRWKNSRAKPKPSPHPRA